MEQLIESIRSAVAEGAPDEAKQVGATACRAILAALEATAGAPLSNASLPAVAASPLASTIATLRAVPPDQLLDLVIAKLRAIAPTSSAPQTRSAPVSFQLVPLPKLAR